jgi:hypothetical protein
MSEKPTDVDRLKALLKDGSVLRAMQHIIPKTMFVRVGKRNILDDWFIVDNDVGNGRGWCTFKTGTAAELIGWVEKHRFVENRPGGHYRKSP